MNFLRISSRTSNHVITAKQITISSASYSINSVQRNQSLNILVGNPLPVSFVSRRNNSIAATVSGFYADISNSSTVAFFQNALFAFHDFSGLPWWATIVISTMGLRLCMFPAAVHAHKCRARLHLIRTKEMPELAKELAKEVKVAKKMLNLDDKKEEALYKISLDKQYKKLIARDNCHPRKENVTLLIQIPIWICQSVAIRNILTLRPDPTSYKALLAFTQLTVGGFLWIPNLTEVDASYILPVAMCLINLANIELIALEKEVVDSKFRTYITGFFRLVSIGIVPLVASVPSCLSLYWCTSTACAFAQNVILLSPTTKRVFKIPTNVDYHMDRPYRTIAERFAKQMERRRKWCTSFLPTNERKW